MKTLNSIVYYEDAVAANPCAESGYQPQGESRRRIESAKFWSRLSARSMQLVVAIILLAPLAIAAIAHKWTMGPLYRFAAARPQVRLQFNISDFFCLFVQVQVLLSAAIAVLGPWKAPTTGVEMNEDKSPTYIIVALVLLTLIYTAWLSPVRTLNRAGILGTWIRSLVLLIIAPFSLASSIGLGISSIAIVAGSIGFLFFNPGPGPLELAIVAVSLLLVLSGLRKLVGAVVPANKS